MADPKIIVFLTREQIEEIAAFIGIEYRREIEIGRYIFIEYQPPPELDIKESIFKAADFPLGGQAGLGGHLVGDVDSETLDIGDLPELTPLTETEIEDNVIELHDIGEKPKDMKSYRRRFWKTFSVVERTPLTALDRKQLAVLGWEDF